MKTEDYELTFDNWVSKYKPMQNDRSSDEDSFYGCLFSEVGDDYQYVKAYSVEHPNNIWTYIDSDLIVPGLMFFNRLGYFITENQWEDDSIYVELD